MDKYCTVGQVTDNSIIGRMRISCLKPTATDTHSECLLLIAFPRKQWIRELASVLHCQYIACFVYVNTDQCFTHLNLFSAVAVVFIFVVFAVSHINGRICILYILTKVAVKVKLNGTFLFCEQF